ncbi:MAG: HD domain-containing protein [Oscillospiraceae bacterium]|nr:HD domain-containing protein [Oscillospiraceae bacterium]
MITFEEIKNNEEIKTYIRAADESLDSLQYTEHSFAHVVRTADVAGHILTRLGYDERTVELGKIAGYMHDIGNVINRIDHAQSGAVMAFRILDKMGMPAAEIAKIVCAIGNHDEGTAFPVNELAAALIIADKSDVRRSRVRDKGTINFDIHDRVNYAVEKSKLAVDSENKLIILNLTIDENIGTISEYFEIFMTRMTLCRRAAGYFGRKFEIDINGVKVM